MVMDILKTFEHNGKILQLAAYEPATLLRPGKPVSVRSPGAGNFEIGAIQLSKADIAAGEDIMLSAQISGKNIAFIYAELLLHNPAADQAYGPVAREHIPAARNKENGRLARPDWDETIDISFRLRPSLSLLTDGVNFAFGFLSPEDYASTDKRLEGLYNENTRARLTFTATGELKSAIAFKEQRGPAMLHELNFKPGDRFTPFVQIVTSPAGENQNWETKVALSDLLTFGGQAFCIKSEPPIPGEYLVGLLIQDLDGGYTRKYIPLTINK